MGLAARISGATGIGTRTQVAVAGLGLTFVALIGLVAAGTLTSIDQGAVDHLMPTLDPRHNRASSSGYYLPFSGHIRWWSKLLSIWAYPCSVAVSLLILVVVLAVLRRQGRPAAAFALIGAWVVGNGIEVVGKGVIERPALYKTVDGLRLHVGVFDHSFPSGHTMRCVIVAGAVLLVWRRAAPAVIAWAALVPACLVLTAAHVPSDILGGGLLGLMVLLLAVAIGDSLGDGRVAAEAQRR